MWEDGRRLKDDTPKFSTRSSDSASLCSVPVNKSQHTYSRGAITEYLGIGMSFMKRRTFLMVRWQFASVESSGYVNEFIHRNFDWDLVREISVHREDKLLTSPDDSVPA